MIINIRGEELLVRCGDDTYGGGAAAAGITLNNERVVVAPHCKDSVIEARHSHGSPALNRVAHT